MKKELTLNHFIAMWLIVIAVLSLVVLVANGDELEPLNSHVAELRWEELR